MTPPINSVSDHILDGIASGDLAASPFEVVSIAKELAARRAANTPVDGVVVDPATILAARDALLADNLNEAWHQLYTMADPTFTEMQPWRNLEHKAALSASPALPSQVVGVSIEQLQAAHVERQEEWCPDQKPDLSFRGNEMAGEVGEACNVIKKLERERHGWRGSRDTLEHLGEELADVVHTAILCAITAGIDLGPYVVKKFNDTSEKNGLKSRIQACLTSPAAEPVGIVVAEDDDLSVYWYEGFAVSEGDELFTHPAPSASREVTDGLRLAFRNADESDWKHLFAVLPDTGRGRFWKSVLSEARAALLAALPEREG